MGRKSRLQRKRRAAKARMKKNAISHDAEFELTCNQLKELFSRYTADDILVSLNVSDLWLPNISSQVKHTLAFAITISMKNDNFKGSLSINSYSDFKKFIKQLYTLLPNFPMLEDYIPECDWGEVKFGLNDLQLRIFYGGAVERISDFITAFNLIHTANSSPFNDMFLALLAQDHILSSVDKTIVGNANDIETGHIEVPTEVFWRECRKAINSLSLRTEFADTTPDLVTKFAVLPMPKRQMDFGNAVITGSALPTFLVKVENRHFPLALRNAAASVIQYWAKENKTAMPENIASFLSARLQDVLMGPIHFRTRIERLTNIFSAAISGGEKIYLVVVLDKAGISHLPNLENNLKRVVNSGNWVLQQDGEICAIKIQNNDGNSPSFNQLEIIAVLAYVHTVPGSLKIPKTKARVLPLPDFVSIFDSIENVKELNKYWNFFDINSPMLAGLIGPVDCFGAFRDSNALLVDGAIAPSMITLDPHWGSTWRYQALKDYWNNAPPLFPDVPNTEWEVNCDSDGLYRLTSKRIPILSWSAVISNCVVHFMLSAEEPSIEIDDGRILEMLIQCLADSLNQRKSILSCLPLFEYHQIVTTCQVKMNQLVSQDDSNHDEEPLFSNWHVIKNKKKHSINVVVQVNLRYVQKHLPEVSDASFEVTATEAWLNGLNSKLGLVIDSKVLVALRSTSARKPRFILRAMPRAVDVPDLASPHHPDSEHYKLARRDLAVIFKNLGAKEGKYKLAVAKKLIDSARDSFRTSIHNRIAELQRSELVKFSIEQLDSLITQYDREYTRIKISLSHEVDFDRTTRLAEARDKFVKDSQNYRYLLECCLSMPGSGSKQITQEIVVKLIASIDWLIVLYNASDVLHNGLDVAGLELDQFFIPHVFYSKINDSSERAFGNEVAEMKLGLGINANDEVQAIKPSSTEWNDLNQAFYQDTEVSLNHFLECLQVLAHWPSAIKNNELHFSYSASREKVRDILVEIIQNLPPDEAEKAISLALLTPEGIRRLIGKTIDEGDVPLWEHNKRGDRYTIKPLIQNEKGFLSWGAASAAQAAQIWQHTLANGYMPADYNWTNTKKTVRNIKNRLEKLLEETTFTILSRSTPYALKGIDFIRRFPQEGFDDVGDFDGLAYWPKMNKWVIAECKYNQPAFCLKDARRLRDRIFGTLENRKQFEKIERRRSFFNDNIDRIRECLDWPSPENIQPKVHELYVCRDIYWWVRNPPYPVPTNFIRVDCLHNWLQENKLLM